MSYPDTNFDYSYKLIVIGDAQVGKSSLIARFVDGVFDETTQPTIGVDFKVKYVVTEDDKIIRLQIWDTAGQERFRSITSSYFRGANGVIVVFDLTNYSSFLSVGKWIEEVREFHMTSAAAVPRGGGTSTTSTAAYTPPIVIVGHKADCYTKRVISYDQARSEAEKYGATYIESSSQIPTFSSSAAEVFIEIANKMYENEIVLVNGCDASASVAAGGSANRRATGFTGRNRSKSEPTRSCCNIF